MVLGAGESAQPLPPDQVLVARLKARDERIFALLLDSWSSGMLRVARSLVSTRDSAAEVVQDTWLAVLKSVDTFEGRSSLKTWVYRILVFAAKRRGMVERRTVPWSNLPTAEDAGPTADPSQFIDPGLLDAGHWRSFPQPWPSPEQHTLADEVRHHVELALAQLPDRQRLVIALRDMEGYTAAEVCEILEISAANQRVLLHRARAFVRGKLEEYYLSSGMERGVT
ncbi:RNA polymerase sigma factor [Actinophytocola sp.]|uniref:RNA polymerase sigma factor n=1 Tax=Actinophytocola sp. TaxID=1872138 RepID=UPI002D7E975F|nr:sigma-70 family RNA polymerase sigma factor [Actinophytocola sp.]HET9143337.1 sigma-70 family RNA polymerase sigma factor [Actinophytocola sp.]